MASLNQCNFIGNVGQIETKYLPSGEAITNLSIAVNDKYKNKAGELVETTEWVRVSFFGKLAEICAQYLQKGSSIFVSGRLKTDEYTDKEGIKRYSTKIIADKMQMLGSKGGASGGTADMGGGAPRQEYGNAPQRQASPPAPSNNAPAKAAAGGSFDDLEDDIPF